MECHCKHVEAGVTVLKFLVISAPLALGLAMFILAVAR